MSETEAPAACSFCLRPSRDVATLVAGPGVFICDRCIALCRQVADGNPGGFPRVAPWELVTEADEALDALPRVAAAAAGVEIQLAGWAARARALGATWSAIGAALGITRQSAWERFTDQA